MDYVDLDHAARHVSVEVSRLKRLFGPRGPGADTNKYRHDLFHVAPLYHRILPPSTSRLLVMDADLRSEVTKISNNSKLGHFKI